MRRFRATACLIMRRTYPWRSPRASSLVLYRLHHVMVPRCASWRDSCVWLCREPCTRAAASSSQIHELLLVRTRLPPQRAHNHREATRLHRVHIHLCPRTLSVYIYVNLYPPPYVPSSSGYSNACVCARACDSHFEAPLKNHVLPPRSISNNTMEGIEDGVAAWPCPSSRLNAIYVHQLTK